MPAFVFSGIRKRSSENFPAVSRFHSSAAFSPPRLRDLSEAEGNRQTIECIISLAFTRFQNQNRGVGSAREPAVSGVSGRKNKAPPAIPLTPHLCEAPRAERQSDYRRHHFLTLRPLSKPKRGAGFHAGCMWDPRLKKQERSAAPQAGSLPLRASAKHPRLKGTVRHHRRHHSLTLRPL